jgi:hypothetical protein
MHTGLLEFQAKWAYDGLTCYRQYATMTCSKGLTTGGKEVRWNHSICPHKQLITLFTLYSVDRLLMSMLTKKYMSVILQVVILKHLCVSRGLHVTFGLCKFLEIVWPTLHKVNNVLNNVI